MILSQIFSLFFAICIINIMKNDLDLYMIALNTPIIGFGQGGTINKIIHKIDSDKCSISNRKFFFSMWDLPENMCMEINEYFNENNTNNELYGIRLFPSLMVEYNCTYSLEIPERYKKLTYFKDLDDNYKKFNDINSWIIGLSVLSIINVIMLLTLHDYYKNNIYYLIFLSIHIFLAISICGLSFYNIQFMDKIISDIAIHATPPEVLIIKNNDILTLLYISVSLQLIMLLCNTFDKKQLLKPYYACKNLLDYSTYEMVD